MAQNYVRVFNDKKLLEEMLMLRQKGYSLPFLANKYQVDHSSILYQCKKFSVAPKGIPTIVLRQKRDFLKPDALPRTFSEIITTFPRICLYCKKTFLVTNIQTRKLYCDKKCYKTSYFRRNIKTVIDEREEKIYNKNYKDYLKEKYTQKQIQRIKKALRWRGGGIPKKTMLEIIAERKKKDENEGAKSTE